MRIGSVNVSLGEGTEDNLMDYSLSKAPPTLATVEEVMQLFESGGQVRPTSTNIVLLLSVVLLLLLIVMFFVAVVVVVVVGAVIGGMDHVHVGFLTVSGDPRPPLFRLGGGGGGAVRNKPVGLVVRSSSGIPPPSLCSR